MPATEPPPPRGTSGSPQPRPSGSGFYVATLTVEVLLKDEGPSRIGGQLVSADGTAAWAAAAFCGYVQDPGGNSAVVAAQEAGHSLLGCEARVTRLRRIEPGSDVDPDWHRHREAADDE